MPVRANLDLDGHRRPHVTSDYVLDRRARIGRCSTTAQGFGRSPSRQATVCFRRIVPLRYGPC